MKVILLDAKEYAKVEGHTFLRALYSFKVKQHPEAWSPWCPVSQFKVDAAGQVYGRIQNEATPAGWYNNTALETSDARLVNTLAKYREEARA